MTEPVHHVPDPTIRRLAAEVASRSRWGDPSGAALARAELRARLLARDLGDLGPGGTAALVRVLAETAGGVK